MNNLLKLAVLALGLAALPAAHATDGVIEINHARALAGGITPGDTPGYPVTISQPGSYRLTSNLIQPDKDTVVIMVTAYDDVTLDLNGFAVTGTNVCTKLATPISCTNAVGFPANGIDATLAHNLTIKNGVVRGIGGACIAANLQNSSAENLTVSHCGHGGIINFDSVSRVKVFYSQGSGVDATNVADSVLYGNEIGITSEHGLGAGLITRNSIFSSISYGIMGNGNMTGNTVSYSGNIGIYAYSGASLIGNNVANNVNAGLSVPAGAFVTFSQNTFTVNGVSLGGAGTPHSLPAGSNWCDTVVCP